MSAWRRELMETFPEFGHAPECWDLIEAEARLGSILEKAARAGDRQVGARVLKLVLWVNRHSNVDERFVYFCQDVLRSTVTTSSLQPYFVSLLNGRTFNQIAGYIEYLTSKEMVRDMAQEIRLRRHAG